MNTPDDSVNALPKLEAQRTWRGSYRDLQFKIVSWQFRGLEDRYPSGAWNYYVYIPETKVPNFAAIWLDDEVKKLTPVSRGRVSHAYYASPLGSVDMHGGITYYQKHGHTEGYRCVEIGCDYQHLHDDGQEYDERDVLRDAMQTIDDLYDRGLIAPEEAK